MWVLFNPWTTATSRDREGVGNLRKRTRSLTVATRCGAPRPTPHGDHRQRGSVYVMVLITSMIVATIGLSALLANRIEHRTSAGTSDFTEARLYAMSAVDMALLVVEQNPTTWRTLFTTGSLPTNQTIGNGTMTTTAVDPIDGNIGVGSDPVVLTGIGMVGQAVYKLQAQLDVNGVLTAGTLQRVVD